MDFLVRAFEQLLDPTRLRILGPLDSTGKELAMGEMVGSPDDPPGSHLLQAEQETRAFGEGRGEHKDFLSP